MALWSAVALAAVAGLQSSDAVRQRFADGRAAYIAGDLQTSRRLLEPLSRELDEGAAGQLLGDTLNILSLIESAEGHYVRALDSARRSAQLRRAAGDRVGVARSLNNAGLALQYLGEYEEALAEYRAALEIDLDEGDLQSQALRLNNIGNIFFFQARYAEALRRYQQALELVDENSDADWAARRRRVTVANLAALHQKMGQYRRALELYSVASEQEEALTPREQALMLSNQGALYRHLGDPVLASERYRQALELFRRQRDADGEIGTLKNLGILYGLDLGRLDEAAAMFERALETARTTSNLREENQALLYLAESLRRQGRGAEAQALLEQALAGARAIETPEEEWKIEFALGQIASADKDRKAARRHLERAVEIIESSRAQLGLGSLKRGFLADKRSAYDALIALEIEEGSGDTTDAQQVDRLADLIEKSRFRAFADRVPDPETRRPEDRSAARQRREIRARIAEVWRHQLGTRDETQRRALQAELAGLENEYLALEPSRPEGRWPGLEPVRRRLAPNTLLLDYWVGPEQLAVVWVGSSAAGSWSRRLETSDREALQRCSRRLAQPGSTHDDCRDAADLLLGHLSAVATGEVNRLIVVPDRLLSELPFEALPTPDGRYLVEDFEVSYLPSAALASATGPPARHGSLWPGSPVLLGIGSPTLSGGDARQWPPLPFARQEIEQVAAILPGTGRILLGDEGRKSALLEGLREGYPVVHLATHALADSTDPERSRIVFSPPPGGTGANYLFLGEVMSLDSSGVELITLSACETAGGGSEGIATLSRAFLINGARTTVASLWRVSDRATAPLMAEFYRRLGRGDGRGTALRTAKRRFIDSGGALADPYYWAGFVLYGEAVRPLPLPWSVRSLAGGAFVAAALAIVACVVLRRRRRAVRHS